MNNDYIKTFPEKIFLVLGDIEKEPGSFKDEYRNSEIPWCDEKQFKFDVAYIRADLINIGK